MASVVRGPSYRDYEVSARRKLLGLSLSLSLGVHTLKKTKNLICLFTQRREKLSFCCKKKYLMCFRWNFCLTEKERM